MGTASDGEDGSTGCCPAANNTIWMREYHPDSFQFLAQTEKGIFWLNTNTGLFTDNEWIHVVGTVDDTAAITYVNGTRVQVHGGEGTPVVSTRSHHYLGKATGSTNFMSGAVKSMQIWNRALTEGEIKTLFEHGATSSSTCIGKADKSRLTFSPVA